MKPKPILMSTPMVQAILEGRKTMTRRTVKFPKDYNGGDVYPNGSFGLKYESSVLNPLVTVERLNAKYQKGYILWAREMHYAYGWWVRNGKTKSGKQQYRFIDFTEIDQDGQYKYYDSVPDKVIQKREPNVMGWYKRPSLFMPYEAARIFLQVTNVRCERLNDITGEDAIAEGIYREYNTPHSAPFYKHYTRGGFTILPIESFQSLWESINGDGSWTANPWVWVYEFVRTEKPQT